MMIIRTRDATDTARANDTLDLNSGESAKAEEKPRNRFVSNPRSRAQRTRESLDKCVTRATRLFGIITSLGVHVNNVCHCERD